MTRHNMQANKYAHAYRMYRVRIILNGYADLQVDVYAKSPHRAECKALEIQPKFIQEATQGYSTKILTFTSHRTFPDWFREKMKQMRTQ